MQLEHSISLPTEITLSTERIDAVCNAAIESSDAEDLPSLDYVLSNAVGVAESALGYGYDLEGEVFDWTNGCIEGPSLGFWDEQVHPICDMAVTYEQHVALALVLHRAQWFMGRVRMSGPERCS